MKKTLAICLLVVFALFYSGNAAAQHRISENLRRENVLLPPNAPDSRLMTVTDYTMVWDGRVPLFIMVTYDDRGTKREIDYTEFYDLLGNLVLVVWTDRFGICQVAMDEGLLGEDDPMVGKHLVLVTGGTPL
jgi:hypothetical protein